MQENFNYCTYIHEFFLLFSLDKCCVNIHVSRLLEHWLDWDRDVVDTSSPAAVSQRRSAEAVDNSLGDGARSDTCSSSNSSNSGCSNDNGCDCSDNDSDADDDDLEGEEEEEGQASNTAKSLILSSSRTTPPIPTSAASLFLPRRPVPRGRVACCGVSSANGNVSHLTLGEIVEQQLAVGDEEMEEAERERGEAESSEVDVQSWIRRFSCARGCDYNNKKEEPEPVEAEAISSFLSYLLQGAGGRQHLISGDALVNLVEIALERHQKLQHHQQHQQQQQQQLERIILPQVRHLLDLQMYREAEAVARAVLLSDPDAADAADASTGRTLLTHSAEHADRAAGLTRLLLNYGARVWPGEEVVVATDGSGSGGDLVPRLSAERERSAFTWFLRGAMSRCAMAGVGVGPAVDQHRPLGDAEETLSLLGAAMGEEPARMRRHVTRTMLALGRGAALNGALFLQLRLRLSPWWREPQPLRHQSARRVRRSLGPRRLGEGRALSDLRLPLKLRRYVRMEEPH